MQLAVIVEGAMHGAYYQPQVAALMLNHVHGWTKDDAPDAGQVSAAHLDEVYGTVMAKSREDGRLLRERRAQLRKELDRPVATQQPAAD